MYVIGRCDQAYLEFLKKKIIELGIDRNIEFLGFVSEEQKLQILTQAKLLINTSYKEGWSLVNIEANARGIPSVAFKVEGNVESVKDGETGVLVEPCNVTKMAEAVIDIVTGKIAFDPQKCINFSAGFDWNAKSKEFYQVLVDACGKLK
jgi:glycosyltransferase involved in cell wall biosynthesis